MNKEKLLNYFKKNKIAFIIGSIMIIGCYYLTHTNFSYHLEDRTGKYILNPEYKEFHKYEWTDLKSVYPTKLAYDPAWFKLPPDKYIPKEQPIPKNISNISDPIIRRQAYFNFLCRTESISYLSNNYNLLTKTDSSSVPQAEGVLFLNQYSSIPKIKNFDKKLKESNKSLIEFQQEIMSISNSDPFLNPIYINEFYPLIENHTYNFYGIDLDSNSKTRRTPVKNLSIDQFVEFISPEGQIFKIEFSSKLNKFLPAKKQASSDSRYYILNKIIDREEMKNLGIYGFEGIVFDKNINKIIGYSKHFSLGSLLPWQEDNAISKFSWTKIESCNVKNQIITNLD